MPELPTITRLNNIGGLGAGFASPTIPDATLDLLLEESGYLNSTGYANQDSVGGNFKLATLSGPNPIFSRASGATFRGSNGLIQYAPENLLSYSEQFDNAYWSASSFNCTRSANAGLSPDGLNTADRVQSSNTTWSFRNSLTLSGLPYTFSVWVKSNTGSNQNFGLYFLGASNPVSGSLIATPQWQRFIVTGTIVTTSTGVGFYSGTSGQIVDLLIWGAQLERSSTARPYISTTTAARYGPRFEYDLNGNPLGLLMEEQSQNLVWYGNSLETTGSKWQGIASGAASSITLNNTTSPTGIANSASLLTFNTAVTGAGSYSTWRQNYVTTTSGTYTFSVWLRSGSNSSVYIRINDSTGNKGKLLCNLTTSWQRFVITSATSGTITGVSADIGADGNAGETMTAGNIYVWGAQLEQKSFATSYIPTVGASATRSADVCLIDGANFRRTNLLTYSEEFNDGAWAKQNINATGTPPWINVATAPDGTQTAEKLIESLGAVNETHLIYRVTSTFATSTTFSVYLKKAERSYAGVAFSNPSDSGVYVNLDTGTVISNLGTAPSSYSVINVGNGWWRISITSSIITGSPFIILSDGTVTTSRAFYTGNGTSGIYIWGAQLEVSSNFYENPSPYIPTTSSAVTVYDRFYNDTEGAILIQGDRNNIVTSGTPDFVNIGDGTTNEYMAITRATGTEEKYIVVDGASPQVNLTVSPAVSANTSFAIAAAYKLNDFSATENGDVPVTDTAGTLPTADRMEIGGRSGRELNGHIKKLRYYNKRVSDINLKYLSSNFTQ